MSEDKTQQYVISTIGVLIGVILIGISYQVGISGSGWVVAIFGVFFGGAGVLSFFNPTISKVLGQIMKNMADNQERGEIHQKQTSPKSSPQTGAVHGNQYINYGSKENGESKHTYNKLKIETRLKEIKIELNKLVKMNHKVGNKTFSPLKKEVKGIIHKIYSDDPKTAEKRLIHNVLWIITSGTQESEYQDWYIEDVEGLIDSINIILREMDLE